MHARTHTRTHSLTVNMTVGDVCLVCSAHDHRCYTSASTCHGDLFLRYSHEFGFPWDVDTCASAALHGHLDCMAYAYEHGCPWNVKTCDFAVLGGHLDCLVYAHERGCPWDARICDSAVMGDHLDCLVYAHEHGCPWDIDINRNICTRAAQYGHLDCMAYAHERGCPYNDLTCSFAAALNHLNCLAYATLHGASWCYVSYQKTEKVVRRWHSLRVIAKWALSVRRKRVRRACSTLARAWLHYAYAPVTGRPGYERAKSNFTAHQRHSHPLQPKGGGPC